MFIIFSLLSKFSHSLSYSNPLKPMFLVPGFMGSILRGNITAKPYWYCPKLDDSPVWINDMYIIPPMHNCMIDHIGLRWDNETNQPIAKDGVSIDVVDFGGLSGITSVDTAFDKFHVVPLLKKLEDRLFDLGYVERETLFGVPNDWRFGIYHPKSYWEQCRLLIEDAYEKNQQQKVVLFGHSMGTAVIQYFLMNYSTPEWRHKYIDSIIYIAPSITGSFTAFQVMWTHKIPGLEFLGEYPETIPKLGGISVHIPNAEVFANKTMYIDENGKQYTGKDLKTILKENGKFDGDPDILKIYQTNEFFTQSIPAPLDLPCALLYVDGLETVEALDRSKGTDEFISGMGDQAINAEGPEFLCKKWNTTYQVDCLRYVSHSSLVSHLSIVWQEETIQFVIDHLMNDNWKVLRKNE